VRGDTTLGRDVAGSNARPPAETAEPRECGGAIIAANIPLPTYRWPEGGEGTMTDITADVFPTTRTNRTPRAAWRALAILMLLGMLSFAAVSDQHRSCAPFAIGVSAIGGCDCIGGCNPLR
jgi:hypothetical protein